MTFQRLSHGPVVAPQVMYIINKAEEYLEDVHTFLKLPIPQLGLSAGGNYSIALVLFGIIDGASKTLYPITSKESDPQFVTLLTDYYPWGDEPDQDSVKGRQAAEYLYYCFRNPLTHNLASRPPDDPKHQRARIYKVEKWKSGHIEEELEAFEKSVDRPPIRGELLSATVRYRPSDDTMVILL